MAPASFHLGKASRYAPNNNHLNKNLPEKLPCARDGHYLPHVAFPKNRLDLVKALGITDKAAMNQLVCIRCNGAPATELTCRMCNKVKGLNGFSRIQRTTPDIAVCQLCMWKRLQVEPGNMRDFDEDEDDEEDPYDNDDGGVSLTNDLRSMSITSSVAKDADDDQEYELVGPRNLATSRAPVSTAQASSNMRSSGGSVRSTTALSQSIGDSSASGSRAWARIRAAPRPTVPRPQDDDEDVEVASEAEEDDWEM